MAHPQQLQGQEQIPEIINKRESIRAQMTNPESGRPKNDQKINTLRRESNYRLGQVYLLTPGEHLG
jgi:hypothetical protein